jgi:hypothetical protein
MSETRRAVLAMKQIDHIPDTETLYTEAFLPGGH